MKIFKDIFLKELSLPEDYYNQILEVTEVKILNNKEIILESGKVCQFICFVEEKVLRAYREKCGEEYYTFDDKMNKERVIVIYILALLLDMLIQEQFYFR